MRQESTSVFVWCSWCWACWCRWCLHGWLNMARSSFYQENLETRKRKRMKVRKSLFLKQLRVKFESRMLHIKKHCMTCFICYFNVRWHQCCSAKRLRGGQPNAQKSGQFPGGFKHQRNGKRQMWDVCQQHRHSLFLVLFRFWCFVLLCHDVCDGQVFLFN